MNKLSKNKCLIASIGLTCLLIACSANINNNQKISNLVPAENFDLRYWKVTLPSDEDHNGKIDEVGVKALQTFTHPDYFHLDKNGHLVFTAPNKGTTTSSLAGTRSELRQMNRGLNKKVSTHGPENNFTIAANSHAKQFSSIGGKLNATLKVNAVSLRAGNPDKRPAYTVVVGQIHSGRIKGRPDGFGWGNQPIKIYYKKFPGHEKGSVFWNYERNLPITDPNKIDISYPIWGNTWVKNTDPGDVGISLGEAFSYEINVHENMMHLTFQSEGHPNVEYSVDLSNNVDAYGKVDELDHPKGYSGDWNYFKAGAYNQCRTIENAPEFWHTACPGTGDWVTDEANGDFTRVTFSQLVLSDSTPVM